MDQSPPVAGTPATEALIEVMSVWVKERVQVPVASSWTIGITVLPLPPLAVVSFHPCPVSLEKLSLSSPSGIPSF